MYYKGREYYLHYSDYEYDLNHPELTRSKLCLPPPCPNPHGGYDLVLLPPLGEPSQVPPPLESEIVVESVVDLDPQHPGEKTLHLHGFDLQLIRWGDGSGVPTSGNNLVVVGVDNNRQLHIRIFDADGTSVKDTDETKLPRTRAGAVSTLKRRLPGLLSSKPTSAEKARLIGDVISIVDQSLLNVRYYDEKGNITHDKNEVQLQGRAAMIANLRAQLNSMAPPHRPTDTEKDQLITEIMSITGESAHGRTYYAASDAAGLVGSSKVGYVTPEAASVRREIRNLENDVLSIPCDRAWFGQGGKHDIPEDACYVGHCGKLYVWVRADGVKELSNLTIKTLKIATLIQSNNVLTIPGPRFTPASGFPSP